MLVIGKVTKKKDMIRAMRKDPPPTLTPYRHDPPSSSPRSAAAATILEVLSTSVTRRRNDHVATTDAVAVAGALPMLQQIWTMNMVMAIELPPLRGDENKKCLMNGLPEMAK